MAGTRGARGAVTATDSAVVRAGDVERAGSVEITLI
jgi:hypothetical protein